jgi:O-antigen/teichoic acid export membrane protein
LSIRNRWLGMNVWLPVLAIRLIGVALQAAVFIGLAQFLPLEDMGGYALAVAAFTVARALGPLGLDQVVMRLSAQGSGSGGRQVSAALALVASGAILGTTVLLAIGWWAQNGVLLWVGAGVPAYSLAGFWALQLRGLAKPLAAQWPESLMLQAVFIAVLWVVSGLAVVELTGVLMALVAASWSVALCYVCLVCGAGFRPDWPRGADFFTVGREGISALGGVGATTLALRLPVFWLGAIAGPASVALYDAAARFGTLASISTSSIMAVYAPRFVQSPGVYRDMMQAARACGLLGSGGLALALVFGVWVVPMVLPSGYEAVCLPMVVLALAQLVNAVFGGASNFALMRGRGAVVAFASAAQIGVVLVLGWLWAGALGMACAVLVGQVVRDFGCSLWLWARWPELRWRQAGE